uniref:Histone deacetylase domain-containing protein n=1 Tax=Clastoptera arizonana TaxID=38151 RepID=A0A1B6CBV8_9HEMI
MKMDSMKKSRKIKDIHVTKPGTNLWFDIEQHQWPIVYRQEYNVHFIGLENLHPFDCSKWGNVFQFLKENGYVDETSVTKPEEASKEDLLCVHSEAYLNSLKWSWNVAAIAEVPVIAVVPNFLIQKMYLRPMRYQVGGTILSGKLALQRGWAINIGGGFHHCNANKGGGFCPYADITLLIKFLMKYENSLVNKAMIIDLDAHQGNGHETDFLDQTNNVYIMDIYNCQIYPKDDKAKAAIRCKVEIYNHTEDDEYLDKVERQVI